MHLLAFGYSSETEECGHYCGMNDYNPKGRHLLTLPNFLSLAIRLTSCVMSSFSSTHTELNVRNGLSDRDLLVGKDGYVGWVPDAKQHPRNWGVGKKTYNVALVCFFEFWMTAISSSGVRIRQHLW